MSKKIVWIFNSVVIIVFLIVMIDFFGIIGSKKTVTLEVKEGDGVSVIAEKFKDEGVILSKNFFSMFCKIGNPDVKVIPGKISVNSSMSYSELIEAIEEASVDLISVTIPEGFENREIADRYFSNDIINDEGEFLEALKKYEFTLDDGTKISGEDNSLSGYLFPDTYSFDKFTPPETVIKLMTDNFKKHWLSEYTKRCEELKMSVDEIVILASIIEREGNNAEDFKLMSSVFHNRLKKGMKLESCATVQYILSERKPILSIADTKIKSPYNTYMNEGLPPAAIASPGLMAIEAALYPEESDYLFFFTDKNGITHFSHSTEEHNSLIAKYGL